jgi:hypothetical protein
VCVRKGVKNDWNMQNRERVSASKQMWPKIMFSKKITSTECTCLIAAICTAALKTAQKSAFL